jgi:hypothetical protein
VSVKLSSRQHVPYYNKNLLGCSYYRRQVAQQVYSLYGKDSKGKVIFGSDDIPPNKIFRAEKLYFDTDKLLDPFTSFFIKRNNVLLHKVKNLIERRENLTYDEVQGIIGELFRYVGDYSGTTDNPYDFSNEREYYFLLQEAMLNRRGEGWEMGVPEAKRCRIVVCTEDKLKEIEKAKVPKVEEMIRKHEECKVILKCLEDGRADRIRRKWNSEGNLYAGGKGEDEIWSNNIGLFYGRALVQFGVTRKAGGEKVIGNREMQISPIGTSTYKCAEDMFNEWFNSSQSFKEKWDAIKTACKFSP